MRSLNYFSASLNLMTFTVHSVWLHLRFTSTFSYCQKLSNDYSINNSNPHPTIHCCLYCNNLKCRAQFDETSRFLSLDPFDCEFIHMSVKFDMTKNLFSLFLYVIIVFTCPSYCNVRESCFYVTSSSVSKTKYISIRLLNEEGGKKMVLSLGA